MTKVAIKSPLEVFKIDVEPSQTVADLKALIHKSKGYVPSDQKLLYSGRPLKDDQLFGKVDFDEERDFIILLLSKAKVKDAIPPPTTAEPSVERTPEVLSFITSNENGEVNEIRPQAAVDVIAQKSLSLQVALQSAQKTPVAQGLDGVTPVSNNTPASSSRKRTIEDVRRVIREDPSFRQYFIRSMTQKDPALAEQLTRNPGFLDSLLLMASNRPESEMPSGLRDRLDSVMGNGEREDGDAHAIQRLVELGFSEAQAREAYLVSDKNEELAVNYLLSASDERASGASGNDSAAGTSEPSVVQQIHEDPSLHQELTPQSIADRDPALGQLITNQNPAVFEQALQSSTIPREVLTLEECRVVKSLVDLGFSEEQAVEAYLVCDKNEELAVDYLINLDAPLAISESTIRQSGSSPSHGAAESGRMHVAPLQVPITQNPTLPQAGSSSNSTEDTDDNSAATRRLVRESLSFRQHLTQSIIQRNPGLGQMINENPALFDGMLQAVCAEDGNPPLSLQSTLLEARDRVAVQHLLELGFTQQQAVEAYLVCDKNEEVALNYLLDQ